MAKKPPLTDATIKEHFENCKTDPELKQITIDKCRTDLEDFLESFFDLTQCQRDGIKMIPSGFFQEQGSIVAVALENDYELRTTFEVPGPEDGELERADIEAGSNVTIQEGGSFTIFQYIKIIWTKKPKK